MQTADKGGGLILLSWLASVGGFVVCFSADQGWDISVPSGPYAGFRELLWLVAGPIISAASILYVFTRCKVTPRRFLAMMIPSLLTLLEVIFVFMVLIAGG
jgi:hypothetical protein